jgi:natural product biosynthesis luciferase-like monooxygenase protein
MDFSVYFFSANDRRDFGERYQFILEVAKFADRCGFRAVWTPERHFQEFGGSFPNPSVLSAALAAVTSRVQLRAGSVVLPLHHPVRVVEEWALVDQLSGGRAGVCVATGWHRGDFVFFPQRYEGRREYSFATLETLRRLWRGEAVGFPGPGGETLQVRTYPRPRQPELPLWIVHSTNPQTWAAAGEHGTNVLTLVDSWARLERNIAAYRQARARAGLDQGTGVVTVGMHTYLGTDDGEVRELVREPVTSYLSTFLTQKQADAAARGDSHAMTQDEQTALAELAAADFYQRRSLLGTADRCAEVVRRLAELGVDEIACLVDFGLPFDTVLDALPRLNDLRLQFQPPTPPAGAAGADAAQTRPPDAAPGPAEDLSWYYQR